ncbi:hypothetical protein C8J55DRAFT_483954 [Lentinula edodes]|uniref:Uncharacterized protein n=1 Tax=Lentinula lateritia TaxID=40482 RepID=A0A9W9E1N4_9AGAR|nr:hypothetical protein C8J55DRAFT_483954 [Lentinula edodes]
MDQSYDSKDAAEALNKMRMICLGNEIWPHISCFLEREGWEDSVEIHKFEEPSCWRMTQSDAKGIFEVIRHMQGVLKDKKLPPICGELQHEEKTATPMTIRHHEWIGDQKLRKRYRLHKWLKEKVKAQSLNIRAQPTLKRRLEFEDEEEDARKQMKGMNIENDENDNEREGTCE